LARTWKARTGDSISSEKAHFFHLLPIPFIESSMSSILYTPFIYVRIDVTNPASNAVMPLHSLYLSLPMHIFRQIAQGNANSEVQSSRAIPFMPSQNQGTTSRHRLRVGYWTSELRHHPVSLLTEDVFRHQYAQASSAQIDFVILALNPDDDSDVSKKIQESAGPQFIRLNGLHHVDVYRRVVEQRLDILVDLDG
jgi:predicted O-linked N-acetylglucosamine transferase (SPINDLY family)